MQTDINSSQKDGQWPSLTKPAPYNKRVHPTTGENQTEEKPSS
jgi:hypothetical protein